MVFRIPKIKTCCCCASLGIGSYVIAAFNVVVFIVALGFGFHSVEHLAFHQAMIYYTVFLNVGAFTLYLIYGLIKADHTLIFPWILQMAVFIIFLLNYLFGSLIYLGLMDTRTEEMIIEFVGTVLVSYSLLVVYNHYRELKEAQTAEPNGS